MKRKPFVIYKMFWTATRWQKWTDYKTKAEAEEALARLQASPSAKYNSYVLKEA